MITYKQIAEFFEDVVLNEGRTDVQNHVGFMNINNATARKLAEDAFGGKIVGEPEEDIRECGRLLYVYIDDDYQEYANKHFGFLDDSHEFSVKDSSGQYVKCWPVM